DALLQEEAALVRLRDALVGRGDEEGHRGGVSRWGAIDDDPGGQDGEHHRRQDDPPPLADQQKPITKIHRLSLSGRGISSYLLERARSTTEMGHYEKQQSRDHTECSGLESVIDRNPSTSVRTKPRSQGRPTPAVGSEKWLTTLSQHSCRRSRVRPPRAD